MEVTLWRAIKIRTLPRNAVMERKIFMATRNTAKSGDNVLSNCNRSALNVS